jgi:hypothetical protein
MDEKDEKFEKFVIHPCVGEHLAVCTVRSLFIWPEKREKMSIYFTFEEKPQVPLLENRQVV